MDRPTVDIYEAHSQTYEARRRPGLLPEARAFAGRVVGGPPVDLGCGPGWYTDALGDRAVALDAAAAMVQRTREVAPGALVLQADLGHLPFRRGSLGGGWARNSYVHLRAGDLPMALGDLHRALAVAAPIEATFIGGATEGRHLFADEDLPGRWFSTWSARRLADVVEGAGFAIEDVSELVEPDDEPVLTVRATRARTLADTIAPGLKVLVCGLNPSVTSADAGIGFFSPGNRFWPAAVAAGLVSRDRDPLHALVHHRVGMTDLVKRATPRADRLTADEYRSGLERLDRTCAWLEPAAVCFVGLAGWRAAVDRRATPGWQAREVGGRPVYVMPSTSGANASSRLADITAHLRRAASPST